MNKVKMLKLSVEDVYTESMMSIESHRYNPMVCARVDCDPEARMIVRPMVRSRVVPIARYFKQSPTSRSETLVSIDMENIEEWLPMFNDQIDVAAAILVTEHARLEALDLLQKKAITNLNSKIQIQIAIIHSYAIMTLWEKFKMLMLHKIF